MPPSAAPRRDATGISHNLLGQRLGKKGRGTRERILTAMENLLAGPADPAVSMSAVAREASLGLPTLYLYFADMTELLLAVLDPIMASAQDGYVALLAEPWPDDALGERCLDFIRAYHGFWERHSRILHLRNALSDSRDERMVAHRIASSRPLIELLIVQMRVPRTPDIRDMASVLLTGAERVVTITTDDYLSALPADQPRNSADGRLRMQARILELGIRSCRTTTS